MRERADRARQLADGDDFSRPLQTRTISCQLRVPQRELEAECHRLCVHAVGASDHRRASVFHRTRVNGSHQRVAHDLFADGGLAATVLGAVDGLQIPQERLALG